MSKQLSFLAITALALLSTGQSLRAAEDPAPALACNSLCRSWMGLDSSPVASPAKTAEAVPIRTVPKANPLAAMVQPAKPKATAAAVPPLTNMPLATVAKPRPVADGILAQARKKAPLAQAASTGLSFPKAKAAASAPTPREAVPTLAAGAPLPMAEIASLNEPVVAALVSLTKQADPAPAIALPAPPPVPAPLVVAVAAPAEPMIEAARPVVVGPSAPAVPAIPPAPAPLPIEAAVVQPIIAPAAPPTSSAVPPPSAPRLLQRKSYDAWSLPLDVIGALIMDTPPQHQAAR